VESFESKLSHFRTVINERLNEVAVNAQPASFYEPVRYVLEGDGKRIRPILLILACQSVGGDINQCLNAAVAIELLHNFTLVHDDIMDHDDLRRGRITVHKKWDQATAILAGDGLVALAYQNLLKTESDRILEISKIFTEGIIDLCEGQALDKDFESRPEIELNEYMRMIEKKTARLLMIASEIGVIIGRGSQKEQSILGQFSLELGCAFQIRDDVLDIEHSSGKSYASDIRQKKKTILFVHALNHARQNDRDRLQKIYQKPEINSNDIETIRSIFETAGSLSFTLNQVETRINNARAALNKLRLTDAQHDLHELLNLILTRKN